LEQIESADAERTFIDIDTAIIQCEKLRRAGTDTPVPQVLLSLYDLIVHFEKGAEIPVRRETLRRTVVPYKAVTFSRLSAVSLVG
jgi:hypothetical protein